jgi:hypothetical protein
MPLTIGHQRHDLITCTQHEAENVFAVLPISTSAPGQALIVFLEACPPISKGAVCFRPDGATEASHGDHSRAYFAGTPPRCLVDDGVQEEKHNFDETFTC